MHDCRNKDSASSEKSVIFVNKNFFQELKRTHDFSRSEPDEDNFLIGMAEKKPPGVLSPHGFLAAVAASSPENPGSGAIIDFVMT